MFQTFGSFSLLSPLLFAWQDLKYLSEVLSLLLAEEWSLHPEFGVAAAPQVIVRHRPMLVHAMRILRPINLS